MTTCRACLQKEADTYYSVFKKIHQTTLERMYHSVTGLSVIPGDSLPNCFCEECADMIVTCNNFRKKCLKSDAQLRARDITVVSEEVLCTIVGTVPENIVTEEIFYEEEVKPTVQSPLIISNKTESIKMQNDEVTDYDVTDYAVYDVVEHINIQDNDDDNDDGKLFKENVESIDQPENSQIYADGTEKPPKQRQTSRLIFNCCACTGVQLHSAEYLKRHGLLVHKTKSISTEGNNCFICCKSTCQNAQLFKDKSALDPTERYSCTKCPASYRGRAALDSHMKSKHEGKRAYVCDVCQKAFHTSSTLISHRQIHGEKKYQCNTCTKSFVRRHDLVIHQKAHSTERPYACTVCDMRFKSRSHLRGHQSVHTIERSIKCRKCGEGFRTYSDRLVHEKLHDSVHPFKCSFCDKKYGRNYKLQVHIRKKHTGEQPFACTDCAKRFVQRWELTAHRRTEHNEVEELLILSD